MTAPVCKTAGFKGLLCYAVVVSGRWVLSCDGDTHSEMLCASDLDIDLDKLYGLMTGSYSKGSIGFKLSPMVNVKT